MNSKEIFKKLDNIIFELEYVIEKEFEEKLENEKELFTKAVENHKNNKIISINNHYKSLLFSQVEMMIIFIKEKFGTFLKTNEENQKEKNFLKYKKIDLILQEIIEQSHLIKETINVMMIDILKDENISDIKEIEIFIKEEPLYQKFIEKEINELMFKLESLKTTIIDKSISVYEDIYEEKHEQILENLEEKYFLDYENKNKRLLEKKIKEKYFKQEDLQKYQQFQEVLEEERAKKINKNCFPEKAHEEIYFADRQIPGIYKLIEYSKDEITPLNNLIGYKMPFYIDLSVKSNIYIQNKSDKDFDKYLVIDHISEIIEHLTLNLLHITPKYQLRLAIIDNSQDINFSKYLKYFNDYNIMKFDKIIRDNKKQSDYLKDLWTLKFERDDLFAIKNVENYYEYNELNGVEPLERRIIIINDFNLLNEQDQKRVMDISSKGCDTGIHFICVGFEKVKSDIYLSQSMNFSEKIKKHEKIKEEYETKLNKISKVFNLIEVDEFANFSYRINEYNRILLHFTHFYTLESHFDNGENIDEQNR